MYVVLHNRLLFKDRKHAELMMVTLFQVADILKLAQQKSLYPMIIFSFARIECEGFAMFVMNEGRKTNTLDFTTDEEKAAIEEVRVNTAGTSHQISANIVSVKQWV